jgi:hypothetical protein
MPKVTITPLVLQTTRSEGWYVHGLAIGAGTSLDSSVMELETEAQRHAEELARDLGRDGQPDAEWHFRVEDVRITAGPAGCAPDETWVAYGTLTSWGQTPWSAGR